MKIDFSVIKKASQKAMYFNMRSLFLVFSLAELIVTFAPAVARADLVSKDILWTVHKWKGPQEVTLRGRFSFGDSLLGTLTTEDQVLSFDMSVFKYGDTEPQIMLG